MQAFSRTPVLFALTTVSLLSACGGGGSAAPALLLPDSVAGPATRIGAAAQKCRTPDVFERTSSAQFFGINDLGDIPGDATSRAGHAFGFIIDPPYRRLKPYRGPGIVTAISNDGKVVGYIIDPPQLSGTWGFIKEGAVPSLVHDPNEGSGNNAVTEFLGVNNRAAVGFYVNAYGVMVATTFDIATEKFTDLNPLGGTSAMATGINDKGDVVGWAMTAGGLEGFLVRSGAYTELSFPDSVSTWFHAINVSDEIVGNYEDKFGNLHGLIVTNPVKDPQWRSFDERYAVEGTALTGINDFGEIDGSYVDGAGNWRPFLCK
jgi:hypothetical protein